MQNTDVSIESTLVENLIPFFSVSEPTNLIEFHIQSSPSAVIDLKNSLLKVQFKVSKTDGTPLTSSYSVSCSNLLLHSLLQNLEIVVNNTTVYDANQLYNIRAYVETHLGYGRNRKECELTSALYYRDTKSGVNVTTDEGQKQRASFLALSKVVELEGPILSHLYSATLYIPNNCQIIIRLKRASPEFVLLQDTPANESSEAAKRAAAAGCPYKIEFVSCRFKLIKHVLNLPVLQSIHSFLDGGRQGKIPFKKTEIKLHHISANMYTR